MVTITDADVNKLREAIQKQQDLKRSEEFAKRHNEQYARATGFKFEDSRPNQNQKQKSTVKIDKRTGNVVVS